jgi:hypothetical protein
LSANSPQVKVKAVISAVQQQLELDHANDAAKTAVEEPPRSVGVGRANVGSASEVDQLSKQQGACNIWAQVEGTFINVRTDWSVCDMSNSVGWNLCPPRLLDALVIPVATCRIILEMAGEFVEQYRREPANNTMPPHCVLVDKLREYSDDHRAELHVSEIEIMVQYDGLLTTHPDDDDLVIAVAIACYHAFLARRISLLEYDQEVRCGRYCP